MADEERDRITQALMDQQEPLPTLEHLPDAAAPDDNVAPLWAMRRPKGSGIAPGEDVNAFPVMPSTFQASAGTEDFDRAYRKAGGDSSGGPDYSKLLAMMGGG